MEFSAKYYFGQPSYPNQTERAPTLERALANPYLFFSTKSINFCNYYRSQLFSLHMERFTLFDYSQSLGQEEHLSYFDDQTFIEELGYNFQTTELSGFVLYTYKLTDTRYSVVANIRKFTPKQGKTVYTQPLGDGTALAGYDKPQNRYHNIGVKEVEVGGPQGWLTQLGVALQGYGNRLFCSHLSCTFDNHKQEDAEDEDQNSSQKSELQNDIQNYNKNECSSCSNAQNTQCSVDSEIQKILNAHTGYSNRTRQDSKKQGSQSKQLAYGDIVRDTQYAFEMKVDKGLHVKGFFGASTFFGEVCKLGVYVAPIAPTEWSPQVHGEFPCSFREQVREVIKVWQLDAGNFGSLPESAVFLVVQKLNKVTFQSFNKD